MPTEKQVRRGLSPQLTLEAAILQQGQFPGLPAGAQAGALSYVQLRGGEPAGRECAIEWKDTTPQAEGDRALSSLRKLIMRFEDAATPYHALVHPMWAARYGDYDHLARVREWSDVEAEHELGLT